jgi:hypothetical protein
MYMRLHKISKAESVLSKFPKYMPKENSFFIGIIFLNKMSLEIINQNIIKLEYTNTNKKFIGNIFMKLKISKINLTLISIESDKEIITFDCPLSSCKIKELDKLTSYLKIVFYFDMYSNDDLIKLKELIKVVE